MKLSKSIISSLFFSEAVLKSFLFSFKYTDNNYELCSKSDIIDHTDE